MDKPPSLYAPAGRRSAGSWWARAIGALLAVLAVVVGGGFAFMEFREGRGGAWATLQSWFGRAPAPAAAPEGSASILIPAPPPGASPAEQLKHYRGEAERQPASAHAWQRLAAAAEAAGETAEARRALVRVIQLQPRVQESWLALAQHHLRQRDWAETEKAARRAVSCEGPRQMFAFALLSAAVVKRENPELAPDIARFAAGASVDPAFFVALAHAMTTLGHTDVSVPMLEMALLQKMAGSAEALAEAYDHAGRAEDAARVRASIKRYGQGA